MPYLCVNKDGQELICPNYPIRWGFVKRETSSLWGVLDKVTGKRYEIREAFNYGELEKYDVDLTFWKDEEVIEMCEHVSYAINLPKGSIYLLTGLQLTWEDEPIEI